MESGEQTYIYGACNLSTPRFLGMADMWGTSITENIIGTGIGAYYGLAHLRKEASPEMSEE